MPGKGGAGLIDRHVGDCIRMRRISLGLSQQKLAAHLGITFQQVQKYEHGKSRVSASRLYQIANVLGVAPGDFFEGVSVDQKTGAIVRDTLDAYDALSPQFGCRELVELNEAFRKIGNPELRRAILKLMQELCCNEQNVTPPKTIVQSSTYS